MNGTLLITSLRSENIFLPICSAERKFSVPISSDTSTQWSNKNFLPINFTIRLICAMCVSKARYEMRGENLPHLGKYTL